MAHQKTIALIGLMGAGKSAFGKALAEKLELPFVDADVKIEKAQGKTIADIFAEQGEPAFRAMEKTTIAQLLEGPPCVLATGGGAFCAPETRSLLLQKSFVIWLKAAPDVLYQRIKGDRTRPLLHTQDPQNTLRELLEKRTPFYQQAHFSIATDQGSFAAILDEILKKLAVMG